MVRAAPTEVAREQYLLPPRAKTLMTPTHRSRGARKPLSDSCGVQRALAHTSQRCADAAGPTSARAMADATPTVRTRGRNQTAVPRATPLATPREPPRGARHPEPDCANECTTPRWVSRGRAQLLAYAMAGSARRRGGLAGAGTKEPPPQPPRGGLGGEGSGAFREDRVQRRRHWYRRGPRLRRGWVVAQARNLRFCVRSCWRSGSRSGNVWDLRRAEPGRARARRVSKQTTTNQPPVSRRLGGGARRRRHGCRVRDGESGGENVADVSGRDLAPDTQPEMAIGLLRELVRESPAG